ncbi:hypothetical protein CC80DRAFT_476508 [Byssothecium circinans]|uniref:Cupredoxin n=1 Tax=Byssothecium circinans TaxID=147558 RepID=A0A6A5TP56_9PLEO|nr:hypothetical protein CC80DRAFT_476508 [Byssothecium circinans]
MHFSSVVFGALAQSLTASAATMMVTVGQNNQFTFSPNTITAQPGDMVAFNFVTQNHSVASSTANRPCQPEQNAIFSDFQPRSGATQNMKLFLTPFRFMVPIADSNPMYIYCSQAQHCQQGMVMVINPPDNNAVQQYANRAAKAKNNVSPRGGVSGGSVQNNAAGTTPNVIAGQNMPAGPNGQITAQTAGTGKGKGKGKGKAAKGKKNKKM